MYPRIVPKITSSLNKPGRQEKSRRIKLTERTVVRPSEDGTKDQPPLVVESVFGVAAVKVPDVSTDVVRAWPVAAGVVDIGAQPENIPMQ